jgi:mannonate dehydratase
MTADGELKPVIPAAWEPCASMPPLRIINVRAICTAPEGIRLVVVKVETNEPELYGLGCATFTQRPLAVVEALETYLKPQLIGRDPNDIEDIYQTCYLSSYWRTGPVLNNALSGVDQALWDIKGKRAGMPVYQLLGGKVRKAATVYTHASGRDEQEVEHHARMLMELGFTHIRAQVEIAGYSTYGAQGASDPADVGTPTQAHVGYRPAHLEPVQRPWHEASYLRAVPKLFEHLRMALGDEVELLHDIHERVSPIQAIGLAKELEQFRLFFLEDPLAPEDIGWFPRLRQQTSIPIAMGELFVNQTEWETLIKDRLIDYIRVHISAIGGLSMARKLAAFAEFFGVRTAWHGPGDVSPVGHAANLHLDLSSTNFGIQELHLFNDTAREVFPGTPEVRDGMLWCNDKPGLGVDVDEELAAKYPFPEHELNGAFPAVRRIDGSVIRW